MLFNEHFSVLNKLNETFGSVIISLAEPEDKGLIMKIDQKLGDALGNVTVSSQFCREPYLSSSLSGWIFKAVSCLQYAHFSFVTFTNDVSIFFMFTKV